MVLFINYNGEENGFVVSGFTETKDGIAPIESRKIDLENCEHLRAKLREGRTIYMDSFDCYLGKIKREGPYSEEEVFLSEYEKRNADFNELLVGLNDSVKKDKKTRRRLTKLGDRYKV